MEESLEQPLAGRHIVVTGGTGALSRALVARLLRAGATCHLPSRAPDHAPDRALGRGTTEGSERLHLVAGVDLVSEEAVDGFYDALPPLWASVQVAGGFAMAPLADTGAADFRQMWKTNLLTSFLCCRAAVRSMRKGGRGGRIVNIAARQALEPRRGAHMAGYAVAKAGVAALTQALAEELKAEQILVNAIAPSTIDTPANRVAMPDADPTKWLAPEAAAEAILQLTLPANLAISGAILPLYARA